VTSRVLEMVAPNKVWLNIRNPSYNYATKANTFEQTKSRSHYVVDKENGTYHYEESSKNKRSVEVQHPTHFEKQLSPTYHTLERSFKKSLNYCTNAYFKFVNQQHQTFQAMRGRIREDEPADRHDTCGLRSETTAPPRNSSALRRWK